MTSISHGDVVLVAFPFVARHPAERKRRPALVVQSDRYNRRRAAVIIAAITSTRTHERLPCKVFVGQQTVEAREAGLKLDSVVDCQTLATVPRDEIVRHLGRFPPELMLKINEALEDALGLPHPSEVG